MPRRRILIADPDRTTSELLSQEASARGYVVIRVDTAGEAKARLETGGDWDAIIVDLLAPHMRDVLAAQQSMRWRPSIIVARPDTRETLLWSMRQGSVDWVDKPISRPAARAALDRLSEVWRRPGGGEVESEPTTRLELPDVPAIVIELRGLLAGELDVDARYITNKLEQDESLVARLLKLANSAAFNRGRRFVNVHQAIVHLGNRMVANFVLAEAYRQMFSFMGNLKTVFGATWRSHFLTACVARQLTREVQGYRKDGPSLGDQASKVFATALLHNIGEAVVMRELATTRSGDERWQLSNHDEEKLQALHPQRGALLVKEFELDGNDQDREFETIAERHHDRHFIEQLADQSSWARLLHIINLAVYWTEEAGFDYARSMHYYRPTRAASRRVLALGNERIKELKKSAIELAEATSAAL